MPYKIQTKLAYMFYGKIWRYFGDYIALHQGTFATGKIRQNIKVAAFWFVLLTKIKLDPESW